jgi:hypothetical protein
MRKVALGLLFGALSLAATSPASAQDVGGRYTVAVIGGRAIYDQSSALEDAWTGGLEAEYNLKDWVAVGFYVMAARPTTDGRYFPLVRMEFSDTVLFELVSQQVTQFDFGVNTAVRVPLGRFHIRALAGIGRYVFNLDDQRIDSPTVPGQLKDSFAGLAFNFGGVAGVRFGETGAVELRVRDFVYTDFDREHFNISEPLLAASDVPHPRPDLLFSEKKSTIHNIHVELGFSFTLGGRQ